MFFEISNKIQFLIIKNYVLNKKKITKQEYNVTRERCKND